MNFEPAVFRIFADAVKRRTFTTRDLHKTVRDVATLITVRSTVNMLHAVGLISILEQTQRTGGRRGRGEILWKVTDLGAFAARVRSYNSSPRDVGQACEDAYRYPDDQHIQAAAVDAMRGPFVDDFE